jgi:UDP-3-O-[3-hydroxymyristoyl] glucosamine N-acyltransferase
VLYPEAASLAGRHPSAVIEADAAVDPTAWIGPNAYVGAGAKIGARAQIGPNSVVFAQAVVGAATRLVAHVTLCAGARIGERCLLHPGVVIGADGFGHAPDQDGFVKIPQVGSVRIGDDVEIGANSTIDRGAIGDTVVERGVKIDNQVQVGHNCHIGEHTVISGCVGISGSVTIGRRCMLGGMVGVVGHLQITDDVYLTGKTMVTHSITKPGLYSGQLPFDEARRFRRNSARFQQLDELARRVRALERAAGSAAADEHDGKDT